MDSAIKLISFLIVEAGLSPDQLFILLLTILILPVFLIVALVAGFLFYLHRLLNIDSQRVDAVMEWDKKFLRPIFFRYSWLRGVEIGVHEAVKIERGAVDSGKGAVDCGKGAVDSGKGGGGC